MTQQLRPVRHRRLAMLVYAAGLLAVTTCIVANDRAYREFQGLYDQKLELLEALKKRPPTGPTAKAAVIDLADASIAAPSETVAASALQRYLVDRLTSAGGLVQSVQAEPKRETMAPDLQRLSAHMAFDASMIALQQLLFDLETAVPFVFVDTLAVQPIATTPTGAHAWDRLRVTLSVTGYWKTGAAYGADR